MSAIKTLRRSVGIRASAGVLSCCFGHTDLNTGEHFSKSRIFPNSEAGFEKLNEWVNGKVPAEGMDNLWCVMAATGSHYENLAYWLSEKGVNVSVQVPGKVRHFAQGSKAKTNPSSYDARTLAEMGLKLELKRWEAPSQLIRKVRSLTRELHETKTKLMSSKNQLQSKEQSVRPIEGTLKRLKRQIMLMEAQLAEIEAELRMLVMEDMTLSDKVEKLQSIPGIDFLIAISILGETNAFSLISNSKQLISYAGMDVKDKASKKERKSKAPRKGNGFIRNALYVPALYSTVHDPNLKSFYERVSEGKPSKKIGVSAVSRKLLVLMYAIWKNDTVYKPDHYHLQASTAQQHVK